MLPQWGVQEIKRMYLASLTHGLFLTYTQYPLDVSTHVQWYTYVQHFYEYRSTD